MKKQIHFFMQHNFLFSVLLMGVATILSFLLFWGMYSDSTANIAMLYILASVLVARYTDGYRYGLSAALFSVICINYLFTYPFFKLNFTLSGYPFTFVIMFSIALITSATTTHLKKQSLVLAEKEKQLAEADKEKMRANLLRAVSHDLRTPLTGIIGSSAAYLDNSTSYAENEKLTLIHNIYDDANWLLNMVENLLSITRIQNDCQKFQTPMEVVDEVVSEAVLRFKKRYPETEIYVSTPEEFLMIPMDAMLIEQVLINLLENALLHSESTSPPLLSVEADSDNVAFHVFDYGHGIDFDQLPMLFDGQVEPHTSADGKKGMGIGLSICKTIILAHNGTIQARNHANGAEFYFTLPKEEHHEP